MKSKITCDDIVEELKALADPAKVTTRARQFGIVSQNALGIDHKTLKELAKYLPKDATLAVALFDTGIYEARLLCSKLFPRQELTQALMDEWITVFDNWEICDSFCMGLFAKSELAIPKIVEWSERQAEFERRAAFATMAAYCMADKQAGNEVFKGFFPLIVVAATDERLYVKKAVNWALRSIGKRNIDLNRSTIVVANEIECIDSKAAKWIAKDALRELEKEGVRISDYPRAIYR